MPTPCCAEPTWLVTGIPADSAANFAAAAGDRSRPSYGAQSGCLGFDVVSGAGPWSPRRWGDLACSTAAPSAPRELKIDRGEASWRLGITGGDERNLGEIRSTFSLDHFLALGLLGGWQLHGDVWVGHPTIAGAGFPIDERTHVSMSRGLPWGFDLRVGASAAAQGGLDPGVAIGQTSEIAAEVSRNFRFAAPETDHRVTLKLAEQSDVNRLYGLDQRTMLLGLTYGHMLAIGSLGATVTYTHVEPFGSPSLNAARAELKFSHSF
jgi:hypothetical protein